MKILLPVSFILLLVSCWKRNDLPDIVHANPYLLDEPKQTATYAKPFVATAGDSSYEISPIYDYDLYGLVVSYKHHNSKFGLHKSWGDHLNIADFCVVWGNNVKTAQLNKLNFWNGQFTCNVETKNMEAWNSFDIYQLSNNHLIAQDQYVRDTLNKVRIGDQIRIRGELVNYKYPQGGQRNSSITRKDTGNGACETIYVGSVEIIQPYSSTWRMVWYGAIAAFLTLLATYLFSPLKAR